VRFAKFLTFYASFTKVVIAQAFFAGSLITLM